MLSSSWRRPCITAAKASSSTSPSSSVVSSTRKACLRVGVVGVRFAAASTTKGKGSSTIPERAGFRNVNNTKNKKKEMMDQRHSNYIVGTKFFGPLPEHLLPKLRHMEEEELGKPRSRTLAELSDLPVIGKGVLNRNLIGKAVEFPVDANSPLKTYGVPRTALLDFRLLARPCSIIREPSLDLVAKLEAAGKGSTPDSRWVLTGPAGCGKSYLMLQAVAHCATNDWIVWYIPRASKMVDSSTPFAYDSRTQMYLQGLYAQQSLSRLLAVNTAALRSIALAKDIELEKRTPITANTSLAEVAEIGSKESHNAPALLAAVTERLGEQTKYPVLLAVDDLQSLYLKTHYRNPHYEHIQPYHLSTPRLLMEYASGKRKFARGAVLGALSLSNTHFPVSLELRDTLQLSPEQPVSPYEKRSPALLEYLQGLQALPVPAQLAHSDAASVFDLWAANRSLHTYPNDELFMSKFSEAGGNARAFVHGGLLASLTT